METEHRKLSGKDNELISWQAIHQNEERLATQICAQAKTRLIPAFLQLLRVIRIHSDLPATIARGVKTSSNPSEMNIANRSSLKSSTQASQLNGKQFECMRSRDLVTNPKPSPSPHTYGTQGVLISPSAHHTTHERNPGRVWCEPLFEVRTSGEPEAESGELSKSCRHLRLCCDQLIQFGHPLLGSSSNQRPMHGVLPSAQFCKSHWNRLFMECERSAAQFLYALICYLEQNATISGNVHVVEYKEADFFFMKNVNDTLLGMGSD